MIWILPALLILYAVHRLVVLAASSLRAPAEMQPEISRAVVLVALRNEAANLDRLLASLQAQEYPAGQLRIVLIDDASEDATRARLLEWSSTRTLTEVISLAEQRGKAAALEEGLKRSSEDFVAVYDADTWPDPDSVRRLVQACSATGVGAVSGFRKPGVTPRSAVARFAVLESLVHQLVTQAGKEKLGWNPTTIGSHCVYRRQALAEAGGFPPGAFSEDVEVSLEISALGWRTRFVRGPEAVSRTAQTTLEFLKQRQRWTYGLLSALRRARGPEAVLTALGYTDRLLLLATLLATAMGRMHPAWLACYALPPFLNCVAAVRRFPAARPAWLYLISPFEVFLLDLFATTTGTVRRILGIRPTWKAAPPNDDKQP